jgi:hypothetical protein
MVNRRWNAGRFDRINAIEKLIALDNYRVAINDYTVAEQLKPATPVMRLDPEVPSVNTDLCHLFGSLEAHLAASASDQRPVFTFLAPMNVHILNTHADGEVGEERAASFYPPCLEAPADDAASQTWRASKNRLR